MIKSCFLMNPKKFECDHSHIICCFLIFFVRKTIRHEKKSKVSNLVLTAFGNIRLWLRRGKKTHKKYALVGGWTTPFEKYGSKYEIFPKQGWTWKKLKPPPRKLCWSSCFWASEHHLLLISMPLPGFLERLSSAKILADRSADDFFPGGGVVMHIAAVILLMEEILHHLGIRKALQILGKKLPTSTGARVLPSLVSPNECLETSSLKVFWNPHWISNPLQTKIPWQLQVFLLIQKRHLSWPVGIQQGNSCTFFATVTG